MKTTDKQGVEYEISEVMPGLIRFYHSNQGHEMPDIVGECPVEHVLERVGQKAYDDVQKYLESTEHLRQLVSDYGWSLYQTNNDRWVYSKVFIRKHEFLAVSDSGWAHWNMNELEDVSGSGSSTLWKFLNNPKLSTS